MKKIILSLAIVLMSATISNAENNINPKEALAAKKAAVENKLEAKQDATLAKIDSQIAKAKAAGKSTENLEKKRAEVIKRISQKENELNKRIEAKKSSIQ